MVHAPRCEQVHVGVDSARFELLEKAPQLGDLRVVEIVFGLVPDGAPVEPVKSNDVDAELGQPIGDDLAGRVIGDGAVADQVHSPELDASAVAEVKAIFVRLDHTVLASRRVEHSSPRMHCVAGAIIDGDGERVGVVRGCRCPVELGRKVDDLLGGGGTRAVAATCHAGSDDQCSEELPHGELLAQGRLASGDLLKSYRKRCAERRGVRNVEHS